MFASLPNNFMLSASCAEPSCLVRMQDRDRTAPAGEHLGAADDLVHIVKDV